MDSVLIGLAGDLLIDRERPDEALDRVTDVLAAPDVLFGNLEASFTDDPQPAPSGGAVLCPAAHNQDAFARAGFQVLSLANNHILDGGQKAMLASRARLRAQGVATCGAGEDLDDARKPAIVEANGVRMAFLAYASVFPMGYEARLGTPGLVPLRAYDLWRPLGDNVHIPGTPPRMSTVTDEGDLERLAQDIARAKLDADLVFTSFHWGDFLRRFHLTDLETRTARWCVDQGVDMVIGHHHHALRGMEWHKGKPILYGLGHFVFDLKLPEAAYAFARTLMESMPPDPDSFGIFPREGWPLLPLHAETRMTVLAYAKATKAGVSEVGLLPCRLRPDGRVETVDPDSEEGREVTDYLERCNTTQRLNARITADGAAKIAGHRTLRVLPVG